MYRVEDENSENLNQFGLSAVPKGWILLLIPYFHDRLLVALVVNDADFRVRYLTWQQHAEHSMHLCTGDKGRPWKKGVFPM